MIRAPEQKVVFFHNPKTAGTSINIWFLTNIPGSRHIEPQHILPTRVDYAGYWTFCVVRNPWDRWVSWWNYWSCVRERIDVSFEEYTLRYLNNEYEGLDGGQYSYLSPQVAFSDYSNCVLRYETLNQDFRQIQDKMTCYASLPNINVGENRLPYQEYYTSNKLIDAVGNFYAKDIQKFGYTYEL
jgi:hypothetical protein